MILLFTCSLYLFKVIWKGKKCFEFHGFCILLNNLQDEKLPGPEMEKTFSPVAMWPVFIIFYLPFRPLMIVTQKITTLAFQVHDGKNSSPPFGSKSELGLQSSSFPLYTQPKV